MKLHKLILITASLFAMTGITACSGMSNDKDGNIFDIDNKNIFFLLTRMQDEVHRFAITFHQSLRNKSMKTSILDGIKGLGDKRKELINRAYPDINLLKEATVEELSQLLPKEVAIDLYNKLH